MTPFRKRLLITLAMTALTAGSVAAYAGGPGYGPMGAAFGEHGKSSEQMRERMEKRQAELREKLKLNANQEAAWNTYVNKMKPGARPPRPDRAEMEKLSAPEHMEKMLEFMKEGEKRLAERIAATKEFYAVLTPEQQKIFNEEFARGWGHRHHRG